MNKLILCPFCDGEAEFEKLGTPRQSSIVTCLNCGCRLESNEEGEHNGSNWNRRPSIERLVAALEAAASIVPSLNSLPPKTQTRVGDAVRIIHSTLSAYKKA